MHSCDDIGGHEPGDTVARLGMGKRPSLPRLPVAPQS